ncbi:MAG: iron transporter [Dehalococcoidia bacterium]
MAQVAGGRPSDEATAEQLELAKEQGRAFERALKEMTQDEAHGSEQQVGDYLIGFAVEAAEGMYVPDGGELTWREPEDENAHLEVSVRDAGDGRFIPALQVTLTVSRADGQGEVGTEEQPFLWHPWLYHYGRNWTLPESGSYDLLVRVEPPTFPRHDRRNGTRYAEPVEARFSGVHIEVGQKK